MVAGSLSHACMHSVFLPRDACATRMHSTTLLWPGGRPYVRQTLLLYQKSRACFQHESYPWRFLHIYKEIMILKTRLFLSGALYETLNCTLTPLEFRQNTGVPALSCGVICVLRLSVLVQCLLVTDGQTQDDSINRASIASRRKKYAVLRCFHGVSGLMFTK